MIQELASQGISVWIENGELRFKPKSRLTPELIVKIEANKARIADELQTVGRYCSWLRAEVNQCGPVCCEELPGKGVVYSCPHFRDYMVGIGRWT